MVKATIFCDRCGKECEDCRNNRGYNIFRKWVFIKSSKGQYLDLCQKCYDELYDWMKLGRKKADDGNDD